MDLTEDSDDWRVLVDKIMNTRIPRNVGKFFEMLLN